IQRGGAPCVLSSSICTGRSWKRKRVNASRKRKRASGWNRRARSLPSSPSSRSPFRSDRSEQVGKDPAPRSRRGVFLRLVIGRDDDDKDIHLGGTADYGRAK